MKELTELLEAATKLVTALGPWWTLGLFVLFLGYHIYKDRRRDKLEKSIADEKENQIQRLAEDNRWMRRILMEKVMGFSAGETEKLMYEGQTKPLLSGGETKKETS